MTPHSEGIDSAIFAIGLVTVYVVIGACFVAKARSYSRSQGEGGDRASSVRTYEPGIPGFQDGESESAAPFDLAFDSSGLGFSVREGRVFVHYPKRDASGGKVYGAGMQIVYPFRFPHANDITRERDRLVRTLSDLPHATGEPK